VETRALIVKQYRLAGDAAYQHEAWEVAAIAYKKALAHLSRGKDPQEWARLQSELAWSHLELAIRVGPERIAEELGQAVAAVA